MSHHVLPNNIGAIANALSLGMANLITALRFAGRYEDDPGTYDSYHMRKIADLISPFCK